MSQVQKVVAYITQGRNVLVFEHRDYPEAGVQVPAGTVEKGEELEAAVRREVEEETGLADLTIVRYLGEVDFPAKKTLRHYFHFTTRGAPENWVHWETNASDTDEHFAFQFRWVSLQDAARIVEPSRAAMLNEVTLTLPEPNG